MIFEVISTCAQSKGLSLSDVEQQAGLGKNTIYNWKRTKPSAEMLAKVADVLGVSVDFILGRDEAEEDDVMAVRERLRNQPGMRMLFDAADGATAAQLEAVAEMIKVWKES